MRISVSEARSCLGQLCARAQDPRQPIVFTRHGRDIAALVSMEEAGRIWHMQQADWEPLNPLSGRRTGGALVLAQGMTTGADGKIVTQREAAEQVRRIQMTRADERRVLAEGGLSPVADGELAAEVPVADDGSERPILRAQRGVVPGIRAEGHSGGRSEGLARRLAAAWAGLRYWCGWPGR